MAVASPSPFPNKCILDNLKPACDSLSKVKSTDTLVFANGEKMAGCFLRSRLDMASNEEQMELHKTRFLLSEILMRTGLAPNAAILSEYLRNPESIPLNVPNDRISDEDRSLINEYANIIRIKAYNNLTLFPVDINSEFLDSKKKIVEYLSRSEEFASSAEMVEETKFINDERKISSCRPDTGAFFNTLTKTVSFQGARSQYPFLSRLRVYGHEMAHAIDPCTMMQSSLKNDSFINLTSCLREDVGQFKQGDQLTCKEGHTREAFCDHFGALLIAEHLKQNLPVYKSPPKPARRNEVYLPPGYEIFFFELDIHCAGSMDSASHPKMSRRLEDILLANPVIAKAAGCPTPEAYCDIKKGTVRSQGANPNTKRPEAKFESQR